MQFIIIQTVKRTTCIREGTNRKNIINKINREIDCVLHNCHFTDKNKDNMRRIRAGACKKNVFPYIEKVYM